MNSVKEGVIWSIYTEHIKVNPKRTFKESKKIRQTFSMKHIPGN